MNNQQQSRTWIVKNLDTIKILLTLAITNWIAHFWYAASFGLYGDDYYRVGIAMGVTGSELQKIILDLFFMQTGQGRFFHDSFIYLFSFLGNKLGGLQAIYWLGYVIVTLNSFLFYALLKRLSNYQIFAVTGALAFILFPADTTQTWLTSLFGLQPSLMLLLLAFHAYISEKKKLSYLIIFGCLLWYETVFPVFLAAPLLKKFKEKWDLKLIKELVRHTLILGAMIVGIVIIRKLTLGKVGVISDPNLFLTLRFAISNTIEGPIISLLTFLSRPYETLLALQGELLIIVLLSFAALTWVLSQQKLNFSVNELSLMPLIESQFSRLKIPKFFKPVLKLAVIGLILLVLAYPLTLTVPANIIKDQYSRVHLAARVGASILCACLCLTLFFLGKVYQKKNLVTVILAAFFALLIGFGVLVQQDYSLAWQYQRAFWTDLVRLSPDMNNETIILVEPRGLPKTKQRSAIDWSTSFVLKLIYQLPNSRSDKPRVHLLIWDWKKNIASGTHSFALNRSTIKTSVSNYFGTVDSSNVILLESKNKQLTRRTEPLTINNQKFPLKQRTTLVESPFEKGPLYDYLIRRPDEEPIKYLK